MGEKQLRIRSTLRAAIGRWYDEATANSTSFSRLAARRRMNLEMSVPAMCGVFSLSRKAR